MSDKKILYFLVLTLFIQIIFSFYYSGEIINQNNLLNNGQARYNFLKENNQSLQKKLATLTSISNIETQITSKSFVLIQNSIDINQN